MIEKPYRVVLPFVVLLLCSTSLECSAGDIDPPDQSASSEPASLSGPPGENPAGRVAEEIEEIIVRASQSVSAIKSSTLLRDLPLSVDVLTTELIDNSQLQDFSRLLDTYTLGIAVPVDGGLFQEMVLRGFTDVSFYRDGLNDSTGNMPVRDLANIESIEILKGPYSAIYGPGEPGGSINFETKKPRPESYHSVNLGLGSHDRYRIELDSTGPVADREQLAYRLVGAIEDSNSFRDFVAARRRLVAPSISWRPGERIRLLGTAEYVEHEAPFDSGIVAVDGSFPLPDTRFLGEPGIGNSRIEGLTSTLSGEYDLGAAWKISSAVYWQGTDVAGLKVVPSELDDVDLAAPEAILVRELQDESIETESFSVQIEMEGEIEFSTVGNQVLAGYEYSALEEDVDLAGSDSEEEPYEIDIFDVEYGQQRPALSPLRRSSESVALHSIYFQDLLKFGENWRVLAGTRMDIIRVNGGDLISATSFDQHDNEFSSRIGLVWTPNPGYSLFASFSESTDPNEGLTPEGEPLKPTQGRALEAGIRIRHPFLDLSIDAAVFRIEQTNVATDAPDDPGFEIQTAKQVSEGLDLELFLRPLEPFQLGVKYGYNDAGISEDPEIPDGTPPLNAPLHKFVVFGLCNFSVSREHDLKTGINFVHASKRQASLDPVEVSVSLPGYSIANVFVRYALSPHVDLNVDISNVFDEDYLASSQSDLLTITPGPPRTVFAGIKVHF